MDNQPDSETSSAEEEECPTEIEPINLLGQEKQALDNTLTVADLPFPPAASNLPVPRPDVEEEAGPSVGETALESWCSQWRLDLRVWHSEHLINFRHLRQERSTCRDACHY